MTPKRKKRRVGKGQSQVVHRLLSPPERTAEGQILLWTEVIRGKSEIMMWTPETPEELEEAKRFLRAVERIDWTKPGIHEVRYAKVKPRKVKQRPPARKPKPTKTKLDLLDVNKRGDENFGALTEVEKDLYVLLRFFILYEMEGITHFFSHHLDHLPRLLSFMALIKAPNRRAVSDLAKFLKAQSGGTRDDDALDDFLCEMSNKDLGKINAWGTDYYSKTQEMWARAKEYVKQRHDVEFD